MKAPNRTVARLCSDSELSRCVWRVSSAYLKRAVPDDNATPGGAIGVQTFGESQPIMGTLVL